MCADRVSVVAVTHALMLHCRLCWKNKHCATPLRFDWCDCKSCQMVSVHGFMAVPECAFAAEKAQILLDVEGGTHA